MKGLILGEGQGTSLRVLTGGMPVEVVSVANRPLIVRQIEALKSAGITEIAIESETEASQMHTLLGDGFGLDVRLRYIASSGEPNSGFGSSDLLEYFDDTMVVMSGGIVTDFNIRSLLHTHKTSGSIATLLLMSSADPTAKGTIEMSENGRIVSSGKDAGNAIANARSRSLFCTGIYVFEREVLELISATGTSSLEQTLLKLGIKGSPRIGVHTSLDGYWLRMDGPEPYRLLHSDFLDGRVFGHERRLTTVDKKYSDSISIECSQIGKDSIVGESSEVIRSVVGNNVGIGKRSRISDSIILDGTKIYDDAEISGAILGPNCWIANGVEIGIGTVLGSSTILN